MLAAVMAAALSFSSCSLIDDGSQVEKPGDETPGDENPGENPGDNTGEPSEKELREFEEWSTKVRKKQHEF